MSTSPGLAFWKGTRWGTLKDPVGSVTRLQRTTRKKTSYLFLVFGSSSHLMQGFRRRAPSRGHYLDKFEAAFSFLRHQEKTRQGEKKEEKKGNKTNQACRGTKVL